MLPKGHQFPRSFPNENQIFEAPAPLFSPSYFTASLIMAKDGTKAVDEVARQVSRGEMANTNFPNRPLTALLAAHAYTRNSGNTYTQQQY